MSKAREKTILVTGASKGIGKACTLELAASGFRVLAGMRDPSSASDLPPGGRVQPVQLDITSERDIDGLAELASEHQLFGLLNNAGAAYLGPLECVPLSEIRKQFEVNLFGHIAVTQAVLPQLRQAKGRIVNISSISGFIGFPFFGAYASSKFAMEGFSESLRRELKAFGVQVSIVEPGNTDTGIWQSSFDRGKDLEEQFPDEVSRAYGRRFARRGGGSAGPRNKASATSVARAVVRAFVDPKARSRYLVGRDAHKYYWLKRLLGDAYIDKIL